MSQQAPHCNSPWQPMVGGLSTLGRRRLLLSLAIAVAGVTLSLLLFDLLRDREQKIARTEFAGSADRQIREIQSAVIDRLGTINTLATYYAGSELVERKEFRVFVKPLLQKRPGIQALGWAPRIPEGRRQAHEQFVHNEGFPAYKIVERNEQRKVVPVGKREQYFPVLFVAPYADNQSIVGFDILSNSACSHATERATSSGQLAVGDCMPQGRDSTDGMSLHVLMHARNDSDLTHRPADQPLADGFVFGIFDVAAIVASALDSISPLGIDVEVVAPLDTGGEIVVCTYPPVPHAHETATPDDRPMNHELYTGTLKVADRKWKVNCVPMESYWTKHRTWEPEAVLAAGLFITALAVGYLMLLLGRTARIELVVAARTRELHESEQRFRRLVDNAGDSFMLYTEKGQILDVNNRACETLGYTREELLSMTLADIDVDYVPKHLERHSDHLPQEYPVSFEGTHRRKDGTTFPVEIRLTTLLLGGQRLMLGLARDIGDRKRLEKMLQEGERKFGAILDHTYQFIAMLSPDGILREANRSALEFGGISADSVRGRPFWETPWWSHSPELQQRLQEAVNKAANGEFVRMEVTHPATDGKLHWIDFSLKPVKDETAKVVFLIAEGRDVTERKQVEEALNDERWLLRTMLDMHERDRKLVAFEIHDGLAQQLTGALYKFQSIEHLRDRDPDAAQETFDEAIRLLRDAMVEARRLIGGLRPPILDESGVVEGINYLISEQRQQGAPTIEFVHPEQFGRLTPSLESTVFRIVQEGLTNACRYSQSEKVRVELGQTGDRLHVEIRDWGIGFDPSRVEPGHFGLQGIRERARLIGGAAGIDASWGQGTRVHADLPLIAANGHEPPKTAE
jgi:PAS domain S-box-containing protein